MHWFRTKLAIHVQRKSSAVDPPESVNLCQKSGKSQSWKRQEKDGESGKQSRCLNGAKSRTKTKGKRCCASKLALSRAVVSMGGFWQSNPVSHAGHHRGTRYHHAIGLEPYRVLLTIQSFILRGHYLKSPNFGLANSQIFWRSYQHLGMDLGTQDARSFHDPDFAVSHPSDPDFLAFQPKWRAFETSGHYLGGGAQLAYYLAMMYCRAK
ncbi:hypothetical protein B0H14DRAFT_2620410 [Mycena olivaceomarginata]|nr:hypothetical protein B0H14DRAFT_2620410 [Mycena olivaceomarginata]